MGSFSNNNELSHKQYCELIEKFIDKVLEVRENLLLQGYCRKDLFVLDYLK